MWTRVKGCIVPLLLLGTMAYAIAEEITLTTYYPSPRGVYDQLRTAGNVQIGRIEPPGVLDPDPPPRLSIYREREAADLANTPVLLVEDQRPNSGSDPDPTPFVVDENGNVGIGTASPDAEAKLDVVGIVRISDASAPISQPKSGMIRWDGQSFQGFNGAVWSNFAAWEGVAGVRVSTNEACPAAAPMALARKWQSRTCTGSTSACDGTVSSCMTHTGELWSIQAPTCTYVLSASIVLGPGEDSSCATTSGTCTSTQWTEAICLGN